MSKETQTVATQPNKINGHKSEPAFLQGQTGAFAAIAEQSAIGLGANGNDNIESYANRLGDSRFSTIQRQKIAMQIGHQQGNHHLQRAMFLQRVNSESAVLANVNLLTTDKKEKANLNSTSEQKVPNSYETRQRQNQAKDHRVSIIHTETSNSHIARWGTGPVATDTEQLLRLAVDWTLRDALAVSDDSSFGENLLTAVLSVLEENVTPDERSELTERANRIAGLTAPYSDSALGIPAALRALQDLNPAFQQADVPGTETSYGLQYMLRGMTQDAASYLAGAQGNDPLTLSASNRSYSISNLQIDLERTVDALTNGETLLEVELEGSVAEVVRQRTEFNEASDQPSRAAAGQQLGEASRRTLLLNQALLQMHQQTPSSGANDTPLDQQVIRIASEIAQIRQTAQQEETTRQQLGDTPSLLTEQSISLPNATFPEQFTNPDTLGDVVRPEEALPQTTDKASRRFMSELQERVQTQQSDVSRLHDQIIPATPNYNIAEFTQIFRRWFSFFSLEEEQQDPVLQMWMQMMGEPYRLMGSAHLHGASAVEGGIARSYLMNLAVEQMQNHMGVASADFAREMAGARRPRTDRGVSGSASEPRYNYAELYPGGSSVTTSGEQSSRTSLIESRSQDTAARFSSVASLPEGERASAAVAAGITPTVAPIVGLRNVQAQEGWSYLINIYDPISLNVVAREHRVVSPEVAQYLLARQQQVATLQQAHIPSVDSTPAGDAAMRLEGVEAGQATSTARFVEGELAPAPAREAQSLRTTLGSAREQAGMSGIPRSAAGQSQQIVGSLVGEMQRYFSAFFEQHQSPEYHLSAILTIANVQFGVGEQLMAMIEPSNIAAIMADAARVSLITSSLEMLGPLGELASAAYQAHLNNEGINDVSAIISVAAFLRNASQANHFNAIRAWSYMVLNVVDDVSQLFSSMVSSPVTHAMSAMMEHRPRTPRELAEACRPMLQDATAREALLNSVNTHISELEAQGAGRNRSDPEYSALIVFREELTGTSSSAHRPDAEPDMMLPGQETGSHLPAQVITPQTRHVSVSRPELLAQYERIATQRMPAVVTDALSRQRSTPTRTRLSQLHTQFETLRASVSNRPLTAAERTQAMQILREARDLARADFDNLRTAVWRRLRNDPELSQLANQMATAGDVQLGGEGGTVRVRTRWDTGNEDFQALEIEHRTRLSDNPWRYNDPNNLIMTDSPQNQQFLEALRRHGGIWTTGDEIEHFIVTHGLFDQSGVGAPGTQ